MTEVLEALWSKISDVNETHENKFYIQHVGSMEVHTKWNPYMKSIHGSPYMEVHTSMDMKVHVHTKSSLSYKVTSYGLVCRL